MKRSIVAALAAVFLAIVGCAAVWLYAKSADSRALAGQKPVAVLVATKRIPAGTSGAQIRDGGYVETVSMPASTLPPDAMRKIDSSLDKLVVTSQVGARQLLLRGTFGEQATVSGGLALPDGKLAVSVPLAASAQVAGYIVPGSKSTIFDSFNAVDARTPIPSGEKLSSSKDAVQTTRILMPKVEVIAVGSRGMANAITAESVHPTAADGTAAAAGGAAAQPAGDMSGLLVTVAVTQDEAERLVHAVQTGSLYLALVSDQTTVSPGAGVNNHTLFN
jgi:pilus assembly protein CpaB